MGNKIKVKEQKCDETLESPRFSVALPQTGSDEAQFSSNYEALTRLIGDNDFVISFSSTLINMSGKMRELCITDFVASIRSLGLEYRVNRIAGSDRYTILGISLGKKASEEQEILAYVPHDIWESDEFKKVLPLYGARFFITPKCEDVSKLLDDMQRMLDREKLDRFDVILFSNIYLNSIGIFTKHQTLDEINKILDI
jgi:hypothetical protein